jgi:hypothetical protein
MCMFCAAIPATLAVGAKIHSQQRQEEQRAKAGIERADAGKLPIKAMTAIAVTSLVVASLVYHTSQAG